MSKRSDSVTLSRKVGTENIIMIRLPAKRIQNIPSHHTLTLDEKSRCYVALLAQVCSKNSFNGYETGRSVELHLWSSLRSSETGPLVKGADTMLPSSAWFSLASASNNKDVRDHLESFGLKPLALAKINLQEQGGSLFFPDGGWIEWMISRPGKKLSRAGVNHTLYVAEDEPGAVGHHIAALLSDPEMDQPGKVHIQTTALEPFLFKGEKFAAAISRICKLEADIIWLKHAKN